MWFILTGIMSLPPGIALRLMVDGHTAALSILGCLPPWSAGLIASATVVDLLTLNIALWVAPARRKLIAIIIAAGALSGIGLGLLLGDPCG